MDSFKRIDQLTVRFAGVRDTAARILNKAIVAVDSYGDRAIYGACAVGIASAIHTAATYQVVRGAGQLRQIADHLEGINLVLPRDHVLDALPAFADFVYQMLRNLIGSSSPRVWYFVYHPDTGWTHHFAGQIRHQGSLGKRFIGVFQDLDAAVIFMRAMRQIHAVDPHMKGDLPHFKLLIPAYYPIVITSPLRFPEEIQPFSLYCDTHDGQPLVWLNLPGVDNGAHENLGLYRPPQSLLTKLFGTKKADPPRTLGIWKEQDEPEKSDRHLHGEVRSDCETNGEFDEESGEKTDEDWEDPPPYEEHSYSTHRKPHHNMIEVELDRVSTATSATSTNYDYNRRSHHHSHRRRSHSTAWSATTQDKGHQKRHRRRTKP
ncbi:hypothetical protein EYZ11_003476 [Aspergillus tanneri]|nr:hypothetical protein EYZ11_003476 [Aspergillus tanneri]